MSIHVSASSDALPASAELVTASIVELFTELFTDSFTKLFTASIDSDSTAAGALLASGVVFGVGLSTTSGGFIDGGAIGGAD